MGHSGNTGVVRCVGSLTLRGTDPIPDRDRARAHAQRWRKAAASRLSQSETPSRSAFTQNIQRLDLTAVFGGDYPDLKLQPLYNLNLIHQNPTLNP